MAPLSSRILPYWYIFFERKNRPNVLNTHFSVRHVNILTTMMDPGSLDTDKLLLASP